MKYDWGVKCRLQTFSNHGNDDYEVLKFKDFQDPLTSKANSKSFKALCSFQGISWSRKIDTFSGPSRKCSYPEQHAGGIRY